MFKVFFSFQQKRMRVVNLQSGIKDLVAVANASHKARTKDFLIYGHFADIFGRTVEGTRGAFSLFFFFFWQRESANVF